MTHEETLLALSRLAQADLMIAELNRTLKAGPKELDEHKAALQETEAAVEQGKLDQKAHEEARGQAEKDLSSTKRKLKQSGENAQRVTTATQMEASRVEINSLEKQVLKYEQKMLKESEAAEAIAKELPKLEKKAKKTAKAMNKVESSVPDMVENARKEIGQFAAARRQLIQMLDPLPRRMYNTAAQTEGNPLTSVVDKICQTCHTMAPPQNIVEMDQGRAIHVCAGCKKIITKVIYND